MRPLHRSLPDLPPGDALTDLPDYLPALSQEQLFRARLAGMFVPPVVYERIELESPYPLPKSLVNWKSEERWALSIFGPTGTGKTFSAVRCMASESDRRRLSRTRFLSGRELAEALRWGKGDDRWQDQSPAFEALYYSIVLIDDIAPSEKGDYGSSARLSLILNRRYEQRLATILTTNLESPAELAERLDPRIASRLGEGIVLAMAGKDRRTTEKKGGS